MDLSRHVIRISDLDFQQLLTAISSRQDFVVVSISGTADGTPVQFSHDSLHACLAGGPEYLYLDVLPPDRYREWTADRIARQVAGVEALRGLMRTKRAAEAFPEMRAFLAGIEELVLLLASYDQQAACAPGAGQVEDLRQANARLSDACFKHEDNVRCMDGLQYEILPALKELHRFFEK